LKAPWFVRLGTRHVAHDLLESAESGTFLIRPSSHRGMYAISWKKGSQIRDNIIYCCWPGYALRKNPPASEKFASLTSLVLHCPFLRAPCPQQPNEKTVMKQLEQQLGLFLDQLQTRLVVSDESAKGKEERADENLSLEWEVCLLEALDTYQVRGVNRNCFFLIEEKKDSGALRATNEHSLRWSRVCVSSRV
jgi:hypothetical protein